MPAVNYFEKFYDSGARGPPGRERLQALVDKVLATGRRDGVEWLVRFGHLVEKVMEAGVPGEDVAKALYQGVRQTGQIIVKKWEEGPDSAEGQSEPIQNQKLAERNDRHWWPESDNKRVYHYGENYPSQDEYYGRHDDDYLVYSSWRGSSPSPEKDFTACDKECGYCGQCDS